MIALAAAAKRNLKCITFTPPPCTRVDERRRTRSSVSRTISSVNGGSGRSGRATRTEPSQASSTTVGADSVPITLADLYQLRSRIRLKTKLHRLTVKRRLGAQLVYLSNLQIEIVSQRVLCGAGYAREIVDAQLFDRIGHRGSGFGEICWSRGFGGDAVS